MSPHLIPLILIFGVLSLYVGAEMLVRGAVSLATRVGLSALVIALTIMSCGTGAPELFISVQSSLAGKGDIAIGNVIGSNVANIGLVLGLSALFRPISIRQQVLRYDGPIMIGVSIALSFLLAYSDTIERWEGILLLLGFVLYIVCTVFLGKKDKETEVEIEEELEPYRMGHLGLELGSLGLGFFLLFLGGKLVLEGAVSLAVKFHISEAVIGLTVVAIGTSLPELATSVVASIKKQQEIALGNVLGSNIFNTLAVVGVASVVHPIHVVGIQWPEYTFMIFQGMFLWVIMWLGSSITRREGVLLLIAYVVYLGYLFSNI